MGKDAGDVMGHACRGAAIVVGGEGKAQSNMVLRKLREEGIAFSLVDSIDDVAAQVGPLPDDVPVFCLSRPLRILRPAALPTGPSVISRGVDFQIVFIAKPGSRAQAAAPLHNISFLASPLKRGELRATIQSTQRLMKDRQALRTYIHDHPIPAAGRLVSGVFQIRDLQQARNLATMLAQNYPRPDLVGVGIWELLCNAVEHGNLEIDYAAKQDLIKRGQLVSEIELRLRRPEFALRLVTIAFNRVASGIDLRITDEGKGFDHKYYQAHQPIDETAPNGRGMAIASRCAFHHVEYLGCGNEVVASYDLTRVDEAPDMTEEAAVFRVLPRRASS